MKRFLIFALTLGIAGALLPWLAVEGIAPYVPAIVRSGGPSSISPPLEGIAYFLLKASGFGFGIGAVLGLIAAIFDLIRHGRIFQGGGHMAANIAWCLLYIHGVIVVDLLFVYLWTSSFVVLGHGIWLPALFCFSAIAWGAIRTVTTSDVLSPRMLTNKLKRSAHIEG